MEDDIAPLIASLLLAAAHLFAPRLRSLTLVPRSRWLSAAGGVSVAYVFVHLLPELAEGQGIVLTSSRRSCPASAARSSGPARVARWPTRCFCSWRRDRGAGAASELERPTAIR